MKGAPMIANTKSHGTNSNFTKSGAPGMLGNILTGGMMGLGKKLFGKKKGGGKPCPPGADPAAAAATPEAAAAAPEAAAATPAAAPVAEDPTATAATMKKGLKRGAPKDKEKSYTTNPTTGEIREEGDKSFTILKEGKDAKPRNAANKHLWRRSNKDGKIYKRGSKTEFI